MQSWRQILWPALSTVAAAASDGPAGVPNRQDAEHLGHLQKRDCTQVAGIQYRWGPASLQKPLLAVLPDCVSAWNCRVLKSMA